MTHTSHIQGYGQPIHLPNWPVAVPHRLSVAAALAPLAVEAHDAQRFISAFLARWGEAVEAE
jgi:hypothetical protein